MIVICTACGLKHADVESLNGQTCSSCGHPVIRIPEPRGRRISGRAALAGVGAAMVGALVGWVLFGDAAISVGGIIMACLGLIVGMDKWPGR